MRRILCFFLLCIPFLALADDIKCYSHGKTIYNGITKNVTYNEGIFIFEEVKTGKVVFIAGDCVVKINT